MFLSKSQKSPLESGNKYWMIKQKNPSQLNLTLILQPETWDKDNLTKKIRTNYEAQGPISPCQMMKMKNK
jgi:hypothetical protein